MAEFAAAYNITDGAIWENLIDKSGGQADKICTLLRFAESYSQPERFINCFDEDATLGDA